MNGTNEHEVKEYDHLSIEGKVHYWMYEWQKADKENESLREQLAKEREIIKRFVDSMALLEVELLKERALRKELVGTLIEEVKAERKRAIEHQEAEQDEEFNHGREESCDWFLELIQQIESLLQKSKSLDEL